MKMASNVLALLALCVLAGGVAAQEDVQKITFTHKPLAAGDVQIRASSTDMAQDITMSMGDMEQPPMNQELKTNEKRRTTILAASEGKVTKLKVEVMDFGFKMLMGGEEPPMGGMSPPDITGKVVIAELTADGTLKVTDEEGNPVDEMLDAVVRGDFDDGKYVGWGPRMEKIVPQRAIAMNEIIDVPKDRAMDFMPGYGGATLGEVESMSLKLVGTKRSLGVDLAVFELEAKFGGSPDLGELGGGNLGAMKMNVEATISGKIAVGVKNLWVYDAELKGPTKMTREATDEMPFSMSATGTVTSRGLSMYTKAAAEAK